MNVEFMEALAALEKEKGISKEYLIDALENALISAYRRNYAQGDAVLGNARADVDRDTGEVHIYVSKSVVDEVENPLAEISLENAKKINPLYCEGDVVEEEVWPKNFGRIAAQTAKQVIVQRIREAEKGMIYNEYVEKENEVLTAIVQHVERNGVYVELGKIEGFIDAREIPAGETYENYSKIKVYVLKVLNGNKGPQVMASRTHPGLVKRLFELEVPEIQSGIVQIKSIAREAGARTKVAVYSTDPRVDAVGSCVGPKGIRVERIVSELRAEKIDIIEWDADPAIYIAKALSPAKVLMVYINEVDKAAKVVVPDGQLSLAIGNKGQNARLAARLTGWSIDIRPESGFFGEDEDEDEKQDEVPENTEAENTEEAVESSEE